LSLFFFSVFYLACFPSHTYTQQSTVIKYNTIQLSEQLRKCKMLLRYYNTSYCKVKTYKSTSQVPLHSLFSTWCLG